MVEIKFSRFNEYVRNFPNEEYVVIFNTLTKGMVRIKKEILIAIKKGNTIAPALVKPLLESGVCVQHNFNEDRLFRYWLNNTRYSKSLLEFTVLTTYDCNFNCVYCYEHGVDDLTYMSKDVAIAVAEWINLVAKSAGTRAVEIGFHGGEPLLNMNAIEQILGHVNALTQDFQAGIKASVVTNGALLSRDTAERLIQLGVSRVMVTLDGPSEIHDQRRFFKGGRPSFTLILNNLQQAIEAGLYALININIDIQNQNKIESLLNILTTKLNLERTEIHFSRVVRGIIPTKHCRDFVIPKREFGDTIVKFTQKAVEKGFKSGEGLLSGAICMMKTDNTFTIDPRGDVYKCVSGVGHDAFRAGDIFNSKDLSWRLSQFVAADLWKQHEQCKQCRYLPLCLGGCPQQLFAQKGRWEGVDCQAPQLSVVVPSAVKMLYRQQNQQGEINL